MADLEVAGVLQVKTSLVHPAKKFVCIIKEPLKVPMGMQVAVKGYFTSFPVLSSWQLEIVKGKYLV